MEISARLETAVSAVRATNAEPRAGWAWVNAAYRATDSRAFQGPNGALTIEDHGMPALEEAMSMLLRDQRVRAKWRAEDVWSAVLSVLSSTKDTNSAGLKSAVGEITNPAKVRIAAPLANVTWDGAATAVGDLTIARIRSRVDVDELINLLRLDAQKSNAFKTNSLDLIEKLGPHVMATALSVRQGELAFEDFERMLEDLVGLTLLLSENLGAHDIHSLRGAVNKPGIRGLTMDRTALGNLLERSNPGEFAAQVLALHGRGVEGTYRWHSADPMPLDRIIDANMLPLLDDLMQAEDPIARRIRVAARWYSRAFWAGNEEDAALAVSVALDSLLTGNAALPGAISKSRFALLERNTSARADRFERYEDVYKVRSTIAHGGDAVSSLEKIGGARTILSDARWVTARLIELRKLAAPKDEKSLRELWSAVQWGTQSWASL